MPLPTRDNHPSGSVLAVNGQLRLMTLDATAANPRDPNARLTTVVTSAATVGATSITLTTTRPVLLDRRFDYLNFGSTNVIPRDYSWIIPTLTTTAAALAGATSVIVTATASFTIPRNATISFGATKVVTTADTLVGTTATVVPIFAAPTAIASATASINNVDVLPLSAALTAATASVPFLPTLTLRGIKKVSSPNKSTLVSIRTMESGLGNEQRPAMIDYSLSVEGFANQQDKAYTDVLIPAADRGAELYFEYASPMGDIRKGICIPSDIGREESVDSVITWSGTLTVQGVPDRQSFL